MPDALRAENLTKRFGAFTAVDGLSFAVPENSVTALLGNNGAGKTTALAMLLGLTKPTSGRAICLGYDMEKDRHAALAQMNFSSPYVDLPPTLTTRENLLVYGRVYTVPKLKARLEELTADLQLEAILDKKYGHLSAGQKTRVSLAKALINRPRLLLLDEPTASLDPDTADWVRAYLHRYRQETGASILMASHHMGEVERLADHVLIMRRGKLAAQGTAQELRMRYQREDLEAVFLDVVRAEEGIPS